MFQINQKALSKLFKINLVKWFKAQIKIKLFGINWNITHLLIDQIFKLIINIIYNNLLKNINYN